MLMSDEHREVALAAINAYFNSRTRALAPVSATRALWSVRKIVGVVPSDSELIELITEFAVKDGIAISDAA
jgi:hypothetical protein